MAKRLRQKFPGSAESSRLSSAVDSRGFRFVKNSLVKPARLFRDFRAAVPGRGGRNGVTVFVKEK